MPSTELTPLPFPTIDFDFAAEIARIQEDVMRAFAIPPRVLYAGFKPYVIVDNTREDR
jgi:hypothetical protein